jgi:RHH-type transcriptional regulator, rel operon repressor / antitoxin RelB
MIYMYISITSVILSPAGMTHWVSTMSSMMAVRIPESIEARLEKLAKRTGRTKTFYVREAILNQIEDLEYLYLAEKRSKALNEGKSSSIAIEELMDDYGVPR